MKRILIILIPLCAYFVSFSQDAFPLFFLERGDSAKLIPMTKAPYFEQQYIYFDTAVTTIVNAVLDTTSFVGYSWDIQGDTGGPTTVTNGTTVDFAGAGIISTAYTAGTLTITGTEVDGSITNEIQTIDTFELVGNDLRLSLSDDGEAFQSVSLTGFVDTDDQTIDVFTISANILNLSLEDDGEANKTVDLSPYLDNTDNQSFTFNTPISGTERITITGSGDWFDIDEGTSIEVSRSSDIITITHEDVSSQASVNNSGNTFIQDITLNAEGHVTGLISVAVSSLDNYQYWTIGDGISSENVTSGMLYDFIDSNSGVTVVIDTGNNEIEIGHADTSSEPSQNNSGLTVIQDITIDTYGHITDMINTTIDTDDADADPSNEFQTYGHAGTTSYTNTLSDAGGSFILQSSGATSIAHSAGTVTISSTDNNDNNYVTGMSFNTGDGVLTLTRSGLGNITEDLDGRYLTSESDDQTIDVFTISTNILNLSLENDGEANKTVDLSPYLDNTDNQSFTFSTPVSTKERVTITGSSDYFDLVEGSNVTLTRSTDQITINATDTDTDDQTVDQFQIISNILYLSLEDDGEAANSVSLASYLDNTDAQTLTWISPNLSISGGNSVDLSNLLDNTDNQSFTFSTPVSGTERVTITGSSDYFNISEGTSIEVTRAGDIITITHEDVSSQASVNNSGNDFIQDITLNAEGHITGIVSASVSADNYSNWIIGDGVSTENVTSGLQYDFIGNNSGIDVNLDDINNEIEIEHANTSDQNGVDNSGLWVIQDMGLDAYGHVISLESTLLDTDDADASPTNELQNLFYTISVSGQSTIAADNTTDNVEFIAGTSIDITTVSGVTDQVTFIHEDVSSQASVNNSGNTFIQDVTLNDEGHVTGLVSAAVSADNYQYWTISDGATGEAVNSTDTYSFVESNNGIDIIIATGTNQMQFGHANTSDEISQDNSGDNFIQDITLDGYGHITDMQYAATSANLKHGEIYDNTIETITLSSSSTWYKMHGTSTTAGDTDGFTESAEGRLRYDQVSTKKFLIIASFTHEIDLNGKVSSIFHYTLGVSGTQQSECEQTFFTDEDDERQTTTCSCIVTLAQNQYVELFAKSDSVTVRLNQRNLNLSIIELND